MTLKELFPFYFDTQDENHTIEEIVAKDETGGLIMLLADEVKVPLKKRTLLKLNIATLSLTKMKMKSRSAIKTALAFAEGKATKHELDLAINEAYYVYRYAEADFMVKKTNEANIAWEYASIAYYAVNPKSPAYMVRANEVCFGGKNEESRKYDLEIANICRKYIGKDLITLVNKELKKEKDIFVPRVNSKEREKAFYQVTRRNVLNLRKEIFTEEMKNKLNREKLQQLLLGFDQIDLFLDYIGKNFFDFNIE